MTAARERVTALGAVFTRSWVVDLILDMVGYREEADLGGGVAVEPAVGHGAFLVPMARRLVRSARGHGRSEAELSSAIRAYDLDCEAVTMCRRRVADALVQEGVEGDQAVELASSWIHHADFLALDHVPGSVQWVIGNPPYVRLEDVPAEKMVEYRSRWTTMSGRADIYIGFIEASLTLLAEGGRIGFICADRWMRNQYGRQLRSLVAADYSMDACIVMHDADAFDEKVSAYPAITVMRRGAQGRALISCPPASFKAEDADEIVGFWSGDTSPERAQRLDVAWIPKWFEGADGWPDVDPKQMSLIADLESRFASMEDVGVRVGVGVATGADAVFNVRDTNTVEQERLVKIVSARETATGDINWAGRYLVNPWDEEGLVNLDRWPGMAAHFENHREVLEKRHVAQRNKDLWWRTLDRVHPGLEKRPKILVPDLKDRIFPVLDDGDYYPSHSLYYLTSTTWDLEVLAGLLMSNVATAFIEAYSVRMANGYLRVSAQYLRRVRLPRYEDIDPGEAHGLREAYRARNRGLADEIARRVYGLREEV